MSGTTPSDVTHADAARWAARRRNGDFSAAEQQAFRRWLEADATHAAAYDEAEKLWRELGGLRSIAGPQLRDARAFLAKRRRRTLRRSMIGLALAASLAGAVSWNAGWLSQFDNPTYRTALGERQSVMLADGSRVELNTASELTVHYSRERREVRLVRGQAAFAVAPGDTRPFEVLAGTGRIRDLGTQFDVFQRAERIDVAVLEGEVEVAGRDGAPGRHLRQGQRLSYDATGVATAIEPVDIAAAGAWRDGRIMFKSRPFREVLAELCRYHADTVVVTAPELLDVHISGTIATDDLAVALTTLSAILPARLIRTGPQSWRIDG